MENTHFGGFSAGLRRSNQLAVVGGILVFGGLALYSPHLNSLDFSIGSVWRPKGQATPHLMLFITFSQLDRPFMKVIQ
jgi:hypothetical protein